ncbi:DNA ligase D [Chenggangzhangella methanolivorans]|uniref:DNA ligase (ATP) n=2 Tax=Chenggangzhangella methanolivorans TaxID=1437009 RepID=A0A9E6R6V1_9HYPH|nr:DNA ligase D [Chenggangzhangella methanolivorans]QZN98379.1 DNA ligase D [Chenggangzhangella methanolivorans]
MARASALDSYRAKRRFDATPEPSGDAETEAGWRYAIQKHDATRLHYDLRLELDGVLLSWAVTRGPSRDTSEKRLAVRTEDHPVDYATFEGVIPEGYGAGTVMLWDHGSWEPVGDPRQGLKDGKLAFHIHGERLVGRWALVRMKPRKDESRENWLLIKEKDEHVSRRGDVLKTHVKSVASGRTMNQIAKGAAPAERSARKSGAPGFVEPMLATLVETTPDGDDWLFEVKFDGYRAQVAAAGDEVAIYTRSGLDWTSRFPAIAEAARKLKLDGCLIDGEIVALDENGVSDFGALQGALEDGRSRSLSLFAFDLLFDGGEDIRRLPLTERKARLKQRLRFSKGPVHYADDFEDGAGGLEALSKAGYEGVVAKRRSGTYRSGRGKGWLKIKAGHRQEFAILGVSPSEKDRPFASLLVGLTEGRRLVYAGRVGSGFSDADFERLTKAFSPRWREAPPIKPPPGAIGRNARWLEPDLVAEVAFAGFTRDGQVRHGRFLGLREDKPARAAKRERAAAAKAASGSSKRSEAAPAPHVRLTHPERELYPGVTKADVAAYLETVAPRMLPFAEGRALSLVRCPEGIAGERFFQKHSHSGLPEAVGRRMIEDGKGEPFEALFVADAEGLASTAQVSALEIHINGARLDRPDKPDRVVFDLDPDETVGFAEVKEAAFELREALLALELESFALLTGGKGVHVVAPLARKRGWDEVSAFAKALAERFAEAEPKRFVATMTKAKRRGKIFIDHFRNGRAASAIAPYSLRARDGAPVACPVTWEELRRLDRADAFQITDAERIAAADPWKGYATAAKQSISARALKALVGD